jgi:hypothetical protein
MDEDLVEGWGPLGNLTGRTKPVAIERRLKILGVRIIRIGRHPACFVSEFKLAMEKLKAKK